MGIYDRYVSVINEMLLKNDISNFKSNSGYNYILEHVSYEQGLEYLRVIKSNYKLTIAEVFEYTMKNDRVGNPVKYLYEGVEIAPTSLRYVLHSLIILEHIKGLGKESVRFVEIGSGYGGLCLALDHFCGRFGVRVDSYNIVEKDEVVPFNRKYLENFGLSFPVRYHFGSLFGRTVEDSDLYLISNWALSGFSFEEKVGYMDNLFGRVSHGFMVWNTFPMLPLDGEYSAVREFPQTGKDNRYIRF